MVVRLDGPAGKGVVVGRVKKIRLLIIHYWLSTLPATTEDISIKRLQNCVPLYRFINSGPSWNSREREKNPIDGAWSEVRGTGGGEEGTKKSHSRSWFVQWCTCDGMGPAS